MFFLSENTHLEVLGLYRITAEQQEYFNSVFSVIGIKPISNEIIEEAIALRKTYNLSVGDAVISATAKIWKLTLFTNNMDDFKSISGLKIINPLNN